MYALKYKAQFLFCCVSQDEVEFERKIKRAFNSWLGLQPKGSGATMDEYMQRFDRVEVIIKVLP